MSDYNNGYDEGYRAGMQKVRELGQDRIKELEAKLAKAVEVMREAIRLSEQPHYGDRGNALDHCFDAIDVLRTTLAELTGGKDE